MLMSAAAPRGLHPASVISQSQLSPCIQENRYVIRFDEISEQLTVFVRDAKCCLIQQFLFCCNCLLQKLKIEPFDYLVMAVVQNTYSQ